MRRLLPRNAPARPRPAARRGRRRWRPRWPPRRAPSRRAGSPTRRPPPPPPPAPRGRTSRGTARAAARASPAPCSRSSRLDGGVVLDRIGAVERREVHHVHEQAAALDVGEELVAEPGARAGAFDQPRDVGQDDLPLVGLDRAEHRLERREGVAGDLRLGAREPRQQRALAGVREAHQARVGQQPQPQLEPSLLPGQPALGHARGLTRRAGKGLVSATARRRRAPPPRAARARPGPSECPARGPPPPFRGAPATSRSSRLPRGAGCPRRGRRAAP